MLILSTELPLELIAVSQTALNWQSVMISPRQLGKDRDRMIEN